MRRVVMIVSAFGFICTGFSDEPVLQLVGHFGSFLALFCGWEQFELSMAAKKEVLQ